MTARQDRARPRGGSAAFSLIEVMIALGVLAFGLLAVASMQIRALQGGASSRHLGDGTRIAQGQLDRIQGMPFADVLAVSNTGWNPPAWVAFPGRAVGEFPLQVDAGGTSVVQVFTVVWRVSDVAGNPNLLNVEVEVSWPDPSGGNNRPTRTGAPGITLASVRYDW